MYEQVVENNLNVYNLFQSPRRHYRIDCPFCEANGKSTPDTKGKLSIFIDSWYGKCHRCGAQPHVSDILREYDVVDLPRPSLDDLENKVKKSKKKEESTPTKFLEPPAIFLPEGYIAIRLKYKGETWMRRAVGALNKWGVSVETAEAMRWHWSSAQQAFLFPTYMNGKVAYYQTRSLDGMRSGPEGYFNPFGILYNWDCPLKEEASEVLVMEGPKDCAIAFQNGLWSVGLHGHVVTPQQEMRLKSTGKRIIFVLDSDVFGESEKIERRGFEVAYLPSRDPAEFREFLRNTIFTESFGIKAKVTQLLKNKQTKRRVFEKSRTYTSRN